MNQKVQTFFPTLNPSSLKDIQGENLHNFKDILLMTYVYHKTTFNFEVRFSTSNALPSPKLFSSLSLIQSNMYYQKKKSIQEILFDIIMYNSYVSL